MIIMINCHSYFYRSIPVKALPLVEISVILYRYMYRGRISMWFFLYKYYKKYKWTIVLFFIISLLSSLLLTIFPVIIGKLIDNFSNNVPNSNTYILLIVYSILFVILSGALPYLNTYITNNINYSIRKDLMNSIKSKKINDIQNNKNNILQIIVGDVPYCQSILIRIIFNFTIQILTFAVILFILFSINLQLSLVLILSIPIYIFIYHYFGSKLKDINAKHLEIRDKISDNIQNILMNFPILKHLSNQKESFYTHYNEKLKDLYTNYRKLGIINSLIKIIYISLQIIIFIIVILWGKDMVLKEEITIGAYITFTLFVFNFFTPIQQLINLLMEYKVALVSVKRVQEIFELVNEVNINEGSNIFKDDINIYIENFNNPFSNKNNFTGVIKLNKINYLIGKNGSGKTTLIKMLNKYIDLNNSSIKFGSTDINSINLNEIRTNVRNLYQTPLVFNYDVTDLGLRYRKVRNHLNPLVIKFIDKYIKLFEDVKSFKDLSAGQKQLFCFIDVLIDCPQVIIVDEGFSNLDTNMVRECMELLYSLKNQNLILIVTHDEYLINNFESNIIIMQ